MKIKDGIQAVQTEILSKFRSILSERKDYESRIKRELTNDYINAKTLDAFIINCIVKYKIHYYELPMYYHENVSFLVKVCKRNVRYLDEIASNDSNNRILFAVLKALDLEDSDIKLLNGKTKKIVRAMPKDPIAISQL